jgi:RNA polymerase sigma factor (sigma-70 family)
MTTCYRTSNAALIARYQAGDQAAAEELLKLNNGLVHRMAHRYAHMAGSLDFEDLVVEGRVGLIQAARRFDLSRGLSFSTLASWHVRSAIQGAIEGGAHPIKLPVHVHEKIRAASRTGDEPEWAATLPRVVASLDAPAGDDTEEPLIDCLPGDADVEGRVLNDLMESEHLEMCLACLRPRDRYVVKERFGIGTPEQSLRAVAAALGSSREGVRQREEKALRRLREVMGG